MWIAGLSYNFWWVSWLGKSVTFAFLTHFSCKGMVLTRGPHCEHHFSLQIFWGASYNFLAGHPSGHRFLLRKWHFQNSILHNCNGATLFPISFSKLWNTFEIVFNGVGGGEGVTKRMGLWPSLIFRALNLEESGAPWCRWGESCWNRQTYSGRWMGLMYS